MTTAVAPAPKKPMTEVERLRAELAAANAKLAEKSKLTFKVSDKGGVSVYGLGRFPVTLYRVQWESLLEKSDDLRAFITSELRPSQSESDLKAPLREDFAEQHSSTSRSIARSYASWRMVRTAARAIIATQ